MQQWTARVQEVFRKCEVRASVSFPDAAKGWIALHCAGLTEEQRAIVKAKSQGKLEIAEVSAALRSCFPTWRASARAKRPVNALVVEPEWEEEEPNATQNHDTFADVEAFLAEHQATLPEDDVAVDEDEAAEALAVSWKERRQEINKLQQSRKFGSIGNVKKSFRVEIEELKRRTRCRKCGKIGHWARECRSQGKGGQGRGGRSDQPGSSSYATEVNYVQVEAEGETLFDHEISFVGAVEVLATGEENADQTEALEAGLVSSPGYGVVDSGCGRTVIGVQTLEALKELLKTKTNLPVQEYAAHSSFRFGNGATEDSSMSVRIPVGIGGRAGVVDAAVISGKAPLLLGRPTLERLRVQLDFGAKTMCFLGEATAIPMCTNQAGQLLINLLSFPAQVPRSNPEVSEELECPKHAKNPKDPSFKPKEPQQAAVEVAEAEVTQMNSKPQKKKRTLKPKECRSLMSQLHKQDVRQASQIAVAELFSEPCLSKIAQDQGAKGIAFDMKQGCDLTDPVVQKEVEHLLDQACPYLLTASPPCTHWGGWDHLNRRVRTPVERARLIRAARGQVRFCVRQVLRQVKRGGEFMFKHPLGSAVWKMPEIVSLKRKFGFTTIDMCAHSVKYPETQKPVRHCTGLICSKPDVFRQLVHRCPGDHEHTQAQGKSVNSCALTVQCAPDFNRAVWKSLGPCVQESLLAESQLDWHALGCECLAGDVAAPANDAEGPAQAEAAPPAQDPEGDRRIDNALKKLHCNLGHPASRELVRVLKHSNASARAIERAAQLQCPVCANHQRPSAPLPANTSRNLEFNDRVGLDVKYLTGWRQGQKIACVNLIDYATSLQIMVPLGRRETGALLQSALRDRWIDWAGPPRTLILDPARPNLGEVFSDFCSGQGVDIEQTAAEAHWQLGKVERHGQWFSRILDRVLDESKPEDEEAWKTCLVQTQAAKNSLLSEAGASPFQMVFGRNPRIPSDLLQDAPHVAASDAIEHDTVLNRANAVRQAARRAFLQCQDDKALRAALRARPRVAKEFKSGDWVYYWRTQKSIGGVRIEGGRWYGAAMVLGSIGKNLIVAHKKSILRCAPEQLRAAMPEESVVADFPDNELLGIKNLLERGQFPKSQFIDLVPHDLPPAIDEDTCRPAPEVPRNAAQCLEEANRASNSPAVVEQPPAPDGSAGPASADTRDPHPSRHARVDHSGSGYGPVRRVTGKSPPDMILHRPSAMREDDFVELMQEVVPRILQEFPAGARLEPARASTDVCPEPAAERASPRGTSQKRSASETPPGVEPEARVARVESDSDEALSVEALFCEVRDDQHNSHIEALMAAFLQKRTQKELPPTGNDATIQAKVDEAKALEWETVAGKQAVRVWTGAKAKEIRARHADRFVGSRFVIVNKTDEDGSRIKARLCLQGHLDPDFHTKIQSGLCHSPTLSQLGKAVLLQLLVTNHWVMNLGDIKGAFLEAGPLPERFRPLYAHQPPGGVPGLPPDAVIEITGNLYGSNDAPFQ